MDPRPRIFVLGDHSFFFSLIHSTNTQHLLQHFALLALHLCTPGRLGGCSQQRPECLCH